MNPCTFSTAADMILLTDMKYHLLPPSPLHTPNRPLENAKTMIFLRWIELCGLLLMALWENWSLLPKVLMGKIDPLAKQRALPTICLGIDD